MLLLGWYLVRLLRGRRSGSPVFLSPSSVPRLKFVAAPTHTKCWLGLQCRPATLPALIPTISVCAPPPHRSLVVIRPSVRHYLGSLAGQRRGWKFDLRMLYIAAMLHYTGLTPQYGSKPETKFGNVKADALADKVPHFRRINVCSVNRGSQWKARHTCQVSCVDTLTPTVGQTTPDRGHGSIHDANAGLTGVKDGTSFASARQGEKEWKNARSHV
jgi:hypothetical protein